MQFSITLLIFLSLWITPTLINYYSGSLESEAIRLPVLAYHTIVLSAVFFWLYLWGKNSNEGNWLEFCKFFSLLCVPLIIIAFITILYKYFLLQNKIIFPFVYRHLDAELLLICGFFIFYLKLLRLKIFLYLLIFLSLTLMEVRGGIIALFIFIVFAEYSNYKKLFQGKYLILLSFFSFGVIFFWEQIFLFLDKWFYITNYYRGINSGFTGRINEWVAAWNEIKVKPLTGYGYYVKLFPFNEPANPNTNIHNFFIRIMYENGALLTIYVSFFLILTIYKLQNKRLTFEIAVFLAIVFYYCFVPRHIQLNTMSVILYLIIIRALISKRNL